MNWNKLTVGKCPKCEHKLDRYRDKNVYRCGSSKCNFVIAESKLFKITSELHEKHTKNFIGKPKAGFNGFFYKQSPSNKQQKPRKQKNPKKELKKAFSEAARKEYIQNMDFIKSI